MSHIENVPEPGNNEVNLNLDVVFLEPAFGEVHPTSGNDPSRHELADIADSMESLAADHCEAIWCCSRSDMTQIRFEQTFIERSYATRLPVMFTELAIEMSFTDPEMSLHYAPEGLVEAYSLWLRHEDMDGTVLLKEEYRLRKFAGGTICISVLKDTDAIAIALSGGPRPDSQSIGWREPEEAEISELSSAISALQGSRSNDAAARKMV